MLWYEKLFEVKFNLFGVRKKNYLGYEKFGVRFNLFGLPKKPTLINRIFNAEENNQDSLINDWLKKLWRTLVSNLEV